MTATLSSMHHGFFQQEMAISRRRWVFVFIRQTLLGCKLHPNGEGKWCMSTFLPVGYWSHKWLASVPKALENAGPQFQISSNSGWFLISRCLRHSQCLTNGSDNPKTVTSFNLCKQYSTTWEKYYRSSYSYRRFKIWPNRKFLCLYRNKKSMWALFYIG